MTDEPESLEREDIQGLVIRGYRMPLAAYVFYRFTGADLARSWLGNMVDPVTTAAEWDDKPTWCANVGLTYVGLEALGLPAPFLVSFPEDFRQGMAARAASRLGDVGVDLPEHWDASPPFASSGVHAVLLVSAREKEEVKDRVAAFEQASVACGLERVGYQPAAALGPDHSSDREHFGFRDGISQPTIRGSGLEDSEHADRLAVAPGEFVLGYPDELGNRPMPSPEPLGRNGSYGVYRKLQQHVAVFRDYVQNKDDGDLLAAKLMGRWPSGAPVALATDADDPALAADPDRNNRFRYNEDPLGFACPRGAHVRRMQPRDETGSSRRRLLLRRGLAYGDELPEGAPDDGKRGLVGLFLNASIERQFEFVQRKWSNRGQFDGLSNEPDPITGPDGRDFTWQRRTGPRRFTSLPRFVTVCGGEYFFLPSITAMRFLSNPSSF
ncbi:MAG: Dyp-type peroxidase [Pseudonocardiaceae bacterium]